ncbi:UPF0259 membrane protein YciC [Buchnera aphidicola (Tuberolachnus salignus)]|uniref:UPF0259 membrane protein YciC n=1 Tax=Buchnera aphidicola subsp. Tuberolachnus salignus TaxID=98804 RepID=A0A160SWU0_BUCTT|nr:YciC family protein [Buchnera aphidicola]CUR53160.1 UPF0259 membrane protein YciC [Buchnera aphidicola (Tuberolachnus salignus)]
MCFFKKKIVHETIHFLNCNFLNLFIISTLCALFTIATHYLLEPTAYDLSHIYGTNFFDTFTVFKTTSHLTINQQKILFNLSFIKISTLILGNTILCSSIMSILQNPNLNKIYNVPKILKKSLFFMPKLFSLFFITASIVEVGFIFFTLTGVILCILLFISPIIFLIDQSGVFNAIKKSFKISWKNITKIFFPIFVWLLCKLSLIIFFAIFHFFSTFVTFFLLQVILNNLTIIIYIYFFYFYIFLKQEKYKKKFSSEL